MSKRMIVRLFLFMVLSISIPGSALAQENQPPPAEELEWIFTGGPRGGIGYDLRIHPENSNIIWVSDAFAGSHQSTDGGQTWTARNEGIDARTGMSGDAIPIFSLTIDPINPDIIWAGVQGARGVFKTTNGGQTWERKDNGIRDDPNMEMRGFTVDPKDSNTVYCGGNYLVNEASQDQRGFIYKTIDGGEHWQLLIEPDALVRWIIVDPTDSNIVYASTGIFDRNAVTPTGVLKSTDGGQTWNQINNGFNNLVVAALAMHPEDPLTLIAGTGKAGMFADEPNEIYGGVFITHDGGESWQQVDPIKASGQQEIRFSAVAFAPSNPDIIYADAGYQFLRSQDGGESWEVFDVGPGLAKGFLENRGQPIALTVHPDDPNTIYMNAYDGGVFLSTDGGRTWRDSSIGYTGLQAWGLALDPAEPAYVVTASKNGVHLSFDSGGTWHGRIDSGFINNMESVAIDPTNHDHILLGRAIDAYLFRSTDGGFSWSLVLGPLGQDLPNERRAIHEIVFAPSDPNIVYTATGIETLSMMPPKNTVGPGVYKSMDNGETWESVNHGLENTTLNFAALVIHPDNPDIVYIGEINSGVYKTIDGGATWSPASSGLHNKDIRALAIDPQNPDTLYAGNEFGGIWKTQDGGTSWRNISGGMPAEATIHSIVIDPYHPEIVYAADMHSGVYRSINGGDSWHQVNNGLEVLAIHDLVISDDGLTLYAATDGKGVYRLDVDGQAPETIPEISVTDYLGFSDSPFQVDGQGNDWTDQVVTSEDPAGDALEGFLDLTTGYVFYDENALYFLINVVDPSASFVQMDISLRAGPKRFNCSVALGQSSAYCNLESDGSWLDLGQTSFSSFELASSFEGRFDLRDFDTQEDIQLEEIVVWTGECCEADWIQADSWRADGTGYAEAGASPNAVEDELSSVLIDGSSEDWADRDVLVNDPARDSEADFLDLTSGYAFLNDEALLFLVEFADPKAPYVQIDFIVESGLNMYNCTVDPGSGLAWCGDVTGGGWEDMGSTQFSFFAIGEALEGRFDLREFDATESYQLKEVSVMVGECCDYPAWRPADILAFSDPVPEE